MSDLPEAVGVATTMWSPSWRRVRAMDWCSQSVSPFEMCWAIFQDGPWTMGAGTWPVFSRVGSNSMALIAAQGMQICRLEGLLTPAVAGLRRQEEQVCAVVACLVCILLPWRFCFGGVLIQFNCRTERAGGYRRSCLVSTG